MTSAKGAFVDKSVGTEVISAWDAAGRAGDAAEAVGAAGEAGCAAAGKTGGAAEEEKEVED